MTPAAEPPLRAVLFDAAGTLIELTEPVGETYARVAGEHGVAIPAWRLGDAFARVFRRAEPMVFPGLPAREVADRERDWWRRLVRSTFLAADGTARFADFDGFFDALYRHFSAPEAWSAREGSHALLTALRERGLATGVVSNFDGRLPAILEGLGLAALLDVVVLPADAGAAKPDPRIFALALERLGTRAEAALFVGDHAEEDVEGARGAGLRAVDVARLATLGALMHEIDASPPEPDS